MKVNFDEKKVNFDTLKVGDTFIDENFDECTVLMVVGASIDVDICASSVVTEEFIGYAVDLSDGGLYGYRADEKVIPIRAEVTVFR